MKIIKEALNLCSINESQFFSVCREIKQMGHVCIIKMDGARNNNSISIIITFPDNPLQSIRVDCERLSEGFYEVIKKYHAAQSLCAYKWH